MTTSRSLPASEDAAPKGRGGRRPPRPSSRPGLDPPRRTPAFADDGTGLAIVAAIVEAHRGTVRLDTAPGAGATFTVTLPLMDARA